MGTHATGTSLREIEQYYDICWSRRFESGHNPRSLAMHLGYYLHETEDSETAKIRLNEFLAERLAFANLRNGVAVDAGCGVGGTSIYLAHRFPRLSIKCLNFSERQINLGKEFAAIVGVAHALEFVKCDYAETGIPDCSVDVVFAIESLCHSPDKGLFFAEAYRILKPGGKFAGLDYVETPFSHMTENQDDYRIFCDGWAVPRYLEDPQQYLSGAGFAAIVDEDITGRVYPGILRSEQRARRELDESSLTDTSHMFRHNTACVALKALVDRNAIRYRFFSGTKPAVL